MGHVCLPILFGNELRLLSNYCCFLLLNSYTECGHPIKNNDTICDTWVFPLLQMGPFGIDREEQATLQLFRKASRHDEILLASGYFNLTEQYMDAISRHSSAKFHLLSAAPEVCL